MPNDCLGSGKRLQNAVRVPIDRTTVLLTQHLELKSVPNTTTSANHNIPQPHGLPSTQQPHSIIYAQANGYNSYGASVNDASSNDQSTASYLPADTIVQPRIPNSYPGPQNAYHTPYASSAPTYVASSYASNDALPATAAAANTFLNHYPQQPPPLSSAYPPNITNTTYSQYHCPGSPTSWRNWAGSMASNLEPGAEYMNSASALIQLGGRSEGPISQNFTVDSSTGQAWPLMLFDGGTGGGQ